MKKLVITSPLVGKVFDLKDVPDPVFANKLVGDGVAIEPFDKYIYAPIDGVVKSIHKAKHAITIVGKYGVELLIHIGLETVALNGRGFKLNINQNDRVSVGDILGEFDLDLLSLKVKSLISPVLIIDPDKYQFEIPKHTLADGVSQARQELFSINILAQEQNTEEAKTTVLIKSPAITVTNEHGIHARPAALISSKAREGAGEIIIEKNKQQANAKSIIALLGLTVNKGDQIFIYAKNQAIIDDISSIINNFEDQPEPDPSTTTATEVASHIGEIEKNCYYGAIGSDGLAIAKIVKSKNVEFEIIENSSDNAKEHQRLLTAISRVKEDLEKQVSSLKSDQQSVKDILSAHLVLLTDPHLLSKAMHIIKQNKTAEHAITIAIEDECKILEKTGNKLLIERQVDLHDIHNRILSVMEGVRVQKTQIIQPSILLADELTPSDILNLDPQVIGLVSIKGGITSHVAILSRARQIPLLVGLNPELLNLTISNEVILNALDGKNAYLNIAPTVAEIETAKEIIVTRTTQIKNAQGEAMKIAATLDGVEINCMGNIANIRDSELLRANGATGVGLFRTEFVYMDRDTAPTVDEQFNIYATIAKNLGDHPLVIRTLDAGGEKPLAYLNMPKEVNPILGMRGIRLCLTHQEIFIQQLTAILKLNLPNVKIMLPMISTIEEYRKTKDLLVELKKQHNITSNIELGIMVEVPSVALQSEIFAKEVDFFSIGTNDLTQYTLAVDREHSELSYMLDHLHPAVLRNIKLVVDGANKYNKMVSVCGMMASDKYAIPILIGLGISNLSMSINSIPANKALIRKLNYQNCSEVANYCLGLATATEVREYVISNFKAMF